MENLKKIGIFFLACLAIVGVGCGIGYMIAAKAPFINILGLLIAIVPAVLMAIDLFKKDTEAPVAKGKK